MLYKNETDFEHQKERVTGVLIVNLGTPEAPTAKALRPYLREFLSDPRIIEKPRWQWFPILYGIVLPLRPRKSAKLYREIWTNQGSPLLIGTEKLASLVQLELDKYFSGKVKIEFGMRYGNPSIAHAIEQLKKHHLEELLVLPLYPQYSATSTASVFDGVFDELKKWRYIPELHFIHGYYDFEPYIQALAGSLRDSWEKQGRAEKLVISYHGIPKSYFDGGDPYYCHCLKTSRLLGEALGIRPEEYVSCFQSVFGRAEWIKPSTEETLIEIAGSGVKSVEVICPGFAVDCLETLQEIDIEYREVFLNAGGSSFQYIPALNYSSESVSALVELIKKKLANPQTA